MTTTDDSMKLLDMAIAAGVDDAGIARIARHMRAAPPHDAAQTAPAEASEARVATKKPHRKDASDATRYIDDHLAPVIRQSPGGRLTGTARELVAVVPWPFVATTPGYGRSLGAKFGFMVATKSATPAGVYVVSREVLSPHGEKNAVRYTLGIRKGK